MFRSNASEPWTVLLLIIIAWVSLERTLSIRLDNSPGQQSECPSEIQANAPPNLCQIFNPQKLLDGKYILVKADKFVKLHYAAIKIHAIYTDMKEC